jgi:1-acyl-sn-glycerol-3-phosphate acyltransferase
MIEALLVGLTRFIVGGHAIWLGGEPDQRQRIYFANHSSHLDTVLIWAALPRTLRRSVHPVAAADYWGKPGLKSWVAHRVLRAVLVERASGPPGSTKSDALAPLRATLADGGC